MLYWEKGQRPRLINSVDEQESDNDDNVTCIFVWKEKMKFKHELSFFYTYATFISFIVFIILNM
jgi:hypothetical protein